MYIISPQIQLKYNTHIKCTDKTQKYHDIYMYFYKVKWATGFEKPILHSGF